MNKQTPSQPSLSPWTLFSNQIGEDLNVGRLQKAFWIGCIIFFNIFDLLGYLLEKNKDLKIIALTLNKGKACDCRRNPVFHIEKRGFVSASTPIRFH